MNADTSYSNSFAGGYCLSTNALRQYIDGTLPKKSLHVVERHLLDCDFCSTVLEDMDVTENAASEIDGIALNVNARIAEMIGSAPKAAFWSGYGNFLKLAAVALTLLGAYLIYHFNSQPAGLADKTSAGSSLAPVIQQPAIPVHSSGSDSSRKIVKEDEFLIKETPSDKNLTPTNSLTAPTPSEKTAIENIGAPVKTEMAEELKKKPELIATALPKKAEPAPELAVEKENYADLQIVSAKVLQKMTKTSGSTRKSSKNGQLPTPSNRNASYYLLEDMPEYPGGDNAMEEYLAGNFRNPVKDKRKLSGPAVAVMFTVSARGKISDVEITRSIGPELDVEIIRLISSMPQWNAGKHKGDITCVLALTVR